jgi:ATP-dependent DNA helicase PIF1
MTVVLEFIDMLNEMRFGRLSNASIAKFKALSREIVYEDGLGATELLVSSSLLPFYTDGFFSFPRREDVDRSNVTRINRLQTNEVVFEAKDGGTITDRVYRSKILANFMAPERIVLRIDAQVMLIKNMDEDLVNGSMGRVVGFDDPGAEKDGDGKGTRGRDTKGGKAGLGKGCPVVVFANGRRHTFTAETWTVELPNGEIQASRTQVDFFFFSFLHGW